MAASAVYTLEPATRGCVRLRTSKGDLVIDLFSREAPESTRNFCQLCVDGRLNQAAFHRIVPETLVQFRAAASPGKEETPPLRNKFHSRLEFRARGFVAQSSNSSGGGDEFFITLKPTPWLNRKHTIIGMLRGQSVFTAVKIGSGLEEDEVAVHPVLIESAELVEQPFEDAIIVAAVERMIAAPPLSKPAAKRVKLSFADEEEEEEEEEEVRVKPVTTWASMLSRDARMMAKLAELEQQRKKRDDN